VGNPELIAAAFWLFCNATFSIYWRRRFYSESIETKCEINLVDGVIVGSHIIVKAKIEGISDAKFQELVTRKELSCI
jgi:osmotically inducible protein OsmC